MPNETNGIAQWLFERLAGDSQIIAMVGRHPKLEVVQVYEGVAPEGATYPNIVFDWHHGRDLRGSGGRRVLLKAWYHVKVYGQGNDFGAIAPIADRVDDLLYQAQDLDDPIIIGVTREMPLKGLEQEAANQFVFIGGEYFIEAYSKAPTG